MDAKTVIKCRDLLEAVPGHTTVKSDGNKGFNVLLKLPDGSEREFSKASDVHAYIEATPSIKEQQQNQKSERPEPPRQPSEEGIADGYNDGDPEARATRPPRP